MEVRHAHERHTAPAVGAHRAARAAADPRRGLTRGEEAAQDPLPHDRLTPGGHAFVIEGEGAEAAWSGGVGGDVHVLRAVAQGPEVVRLDEARPGVGRLGAVDAVELGRVADGLVHLQARLLRVDHDGRDPGRALVSAKERRRLLAYARRLALEPELVHELPAGLRARAAVGARVAADLGDAVARRQCVHAAAALDDLLLRRGAVGRDEELVLALCADRRGGDLHVLVLQRLLGAQAELDLLRDGNGERVAVDDGAELAAGRLDRGQRANVSAGRGFREGNRLARRLLRAVRVELPLAGEAPGAVDEDAYADPLRLAVVQPLDAAVARADHLRSSDDHARVRIGRPRAESCCDRLLAQLKHSAVP